MLAGLQRQRFLGLLDDELDAAGADAIAGLEVSGA